MMEKTIYMHLSQNASLEITGVDHEVFNLTSSNPNLPLIKDAVTKLRISVQVWGDGDHVQSVIQK